MPPVPDRKPLSLEEIAMVLFRLSLFEEEYPEAEFAEVVARRDEFIPHLIEMLEEFVDDPESALNIPGDGGHFVAMYLLAQFREAKALPLLLQLCMHTPSNVLADVLNGVDDEDLAAILASVSGGSIDALRPLAEARGTAPSNRTLALDAMQILLAEGVIMRAELTGYFSAYADKLHRAGDHDMWTSLALIASELAMDELREPLRRAWEQGWIAPDIVTWEEIDRDLAADPEVALEVYAERETQHRIDNACERMRWLAEPVGSDSSDVERNPFFNAVEQYFEEQSLMEEVLEAAEADFRKRTVGRNDLCPCGSGKKYKKCCGQG
jgi:hypothetical protein